VICILSFTQPQPPQHLIGIIDEVTKFASRQAATRQKQNTVVIHIPVCFTFQFKHYLHRHYGVGTDFFGMSGKGYELY